MTNTNALDLALNSLDEATKSLSSPSSSSQQQPWSPSLVITLNMSLLVFGLIICGLMAFLIYKDKKAIDLLRVFSLPLIIVSAVMLVVTGYNDRQMSPVIGLLGTIAGYLLGSHDSSKRQAVAASPGPSPTTPPPTT